MRLTDFLIDDEHGDADGDPYSRVLDASRELQAAENLIHEALNFERGSLIGFNDHRETTHGMVIHALRTARATGKRLLAQA